MVRLSASLIAHGAAMTDYCTRNNRAQIVYTKNLSEGLPPLGMWSEMQINMAKYAQKFSKKPVKKPILRFEVSPSLEESKGWTYDDWNRFAIRFLNELVKASQRTSKNGKKKYGIDLSRAQIFACLHYDSKSSIPHLHILINRIDLDGNLVDDSFIGKNCVKAAHAINVLKAGSCPRIYTMRTSKRNRCLLQGAFKKCEHTLGMTMKTGSGRLVMT